MTQPQTLQDLFEWVCQQYPGAHISLTLEITRAQPWMNTPRKVEGDYELYISDIARFNGRTEADLIEKTIYGLKSLLDQTKAQADDVYASMKEWRRAETTPSTPLTRSQTAQ